MQIDASLDCDWSNSRRVAKYWPRVVSKRIVPFGLPYTGGSKGRSQGRDDTGGKLSLFPLFLAQVPCSLFFFLASSLFPFLFPGRVPSSLIILGTVPSSVNFLQTSHIKNAPSTDKNTDNREKY